MLDYHILNMKVKKISLQKYSFLLVFQKYNVFICRVTYNYKQTQMLTDVSIEISGCSCLCHASNERLEYLDKLREI